MNKLFISILAVAGLVSTTLSFAGDSVASGYYSTQHPQAALTAGTTMFPPTDITVTNATNSPIYVAVPNTPIYDQLYPHTNDHIRHNTYAGNTTLSIQDPYKREFKIITVCRLARVTVYGYGYNDVDVDTELCN